MQLAEERFSEQFRETFARTGWWYVSAPCLEKRTSRTFLL